MSSVSRSVYQKLAEENKRLLHDIYILTLPSDHKNTVQFMDKLDIINRWREKFAKDEEFNNMLKELLLKHSKS